MSSNMEDPSSLTAAIASSTETRTRANSASSFRFLDLPAEIRNRIYSYNITDDQKQDFAKLKTPAVARASKQLRNECLPIFFAESEFYVNSFTNLWFNSLADANSSILRYMGFRNMPKVEAGKLLVHQGVEELLKRLGNQALFRHFHLQVHENFWFGTEGLKSWKIDGVFDFVLEWTKDGLQVQVVKGAFYPSAGLGSSLEDAEPYDAMMERVKSKAEKIVARAGFKGFTLDDWKSIAEESRVE